MGQNYTVYSYDVAYRMAPMMMTSDYHWVSQNIRGL